MALIAVVVASFSMSVLTLKRVDALRPSETLQEVLYVSSPTVIRHMSLGFDALLADVYWTRAVQYFGSRHKRNSMEYKLLAPLLQITTTLDPNLIPAYNFGSVFLAEDPPAGAGDPQAAVALLERGIRANPEDWHLYQDLGFVEYMELHDYPAAGKAFEQASQIPGAHPFLKVMAAQTLQRGGEATTSKMLWQSLYDSSSNPTVRGNALKHLSALVVDEEVSQLQSLVDLFHQKTGRYPINFAELVQARLLNRIPRDPLGNPYQLGPDGRVEVQDYLDLPFITKGLPPGQEPSNFDYSSRSD